MQTTLVGMVLAALALAGCAATSPTPAPTANRAVPAKCTACHLAPAEHSLRADRWDRYLKNHKRRLRLSDEEKAFLHDFLVGGPPPPEADAAPPP